MVQELSKNYPVRELCAVLELTRSGYYAWRRSQETARQVANRLLAQQIQRVYHEKKGRYGSPRVTQQLRREGQRCNHKRVERLMRQQGLKGCSSRKRRVRTTDSDHDQPIAPNLLLGRAAPSRPNEVWVADITYVPTAEGWLFLAAVMDLYSRQILGWSVWESLQAEGALQALKRALANRRPPKGVLHHSDRGVQYACQAYRKQLKAAGLVASMSRRGNCYDNAAMEAFWSTL
jgi:putative transposase